MGREVRMVPATWEHPKDEKDRYVPLLKGCTYQTDLADWSTCKDHWQQVQQPKTENYMPDWSEEKATHYQMYETCSEGTPISPPMATKEELAQWLVDEKVDTFTSSRPSYDSWLETIKMGWRPTFIGGLNTPHLSAS